ncbi:MAG: hypothetical protein RR839_00605 [Oscillospiraceae bacterium]
MQDRQKMIETKRYFVSVIYNYDTNKIDLVVCDKENGYKVLNKFDIKEEK